MMGWGLLIGTTHLPRFGSSFAVESNLFVGSNRRLSNPAQNITVIECAFLLRADRCRRGRQQHKERES